MFPTSNFDAFSRNPAVFRQKRLEGMEKGEKNKGQPNALRPENRRAFNDIRFRQYRVNSFVRYCLYSFSRRALLSRTSLFSSSIKLDTSVNCRYTEAKRT